jgi:hypothetical protein
LPKRQRRLCKFEGLIISLYGRGITQAQIIDHLEEIYGVALSVELISNITVAVAVAAAVAGLPGRVSGRAAAECAGDAVKNSLRFGSFHISHPFTRSLYRLTTCIAKSDHASSVGIQKAGSG